MKERFCVNATRERPLSLRRHSAALPHNRRVANCDETVIRMKTVFILFSLILIQETRAFAPVDPSTRITSSKHRFSKRASIRHGLAAVLRRPAISSVTHLPMSSYDSLDSTKPSELSDSQVEELIERTFIHACLQLAEGYVDVLKLFIVAVKTAYQRHIPVNILIQQVNALPPVTAGRDLDQAEAQLRSTWIQAVYLMLAYIEYDSISRSEENSDNIWTLKEVGGTLDQQVISKYTPVLPRMVAMREQQRSQQDVLKVVDKLLPQQEENDVVDQAITTQTVRVLWYTLVVLSEEARADPKQPDIPGTY